MPPPGFGCTSLQRNSNTVADWHTDYRNSGPSVTVAVGRHTGGELEVEGLSPTKLDFEGVLVDGRVRHRSLPFVGERCSVVALTRECRLNLTPAAMAEARALGYQPTSGVFLEAWPTTLARHRQGEGSALRGASRAVRMRLGVVVARGGVRRAVFGHD